MTQRDFYNAVIATVDNDELKAFATEAIAKLDERNAKRASKESKTQIANKPIIEAISRVLTDEPMLARSNPPLFYCLKIKSNICSANATGRKKSQN